MSFTEPLVLRYSRRGDLGRQRGLQNEETRRQSLSGSDRVRFSQNLYRALQAGISTRRVVNSRVYAALVQRAGRITSKFPSPREFLLRRAGQLFCSPGIERTISRRGTIQPSNCELDLDES